jgi:hypothetical protein
MSAPISRETRNITTMLKRFNCSIGRLHMTKTKSLILACLLVGALLTLLSAPLQAAGPSPRDSDEQPANTFSILLSGPYKPVPVKPPVDCPNLGLFQVNLCDGSFSTTKIYAVSGLPEEDSGQANRGNRDRETDDPIGKFYVQFAGIHAAYDLPGGSLTMVFTADNLVPFPDGQGGTYLVGNLTLDITEATGIYKSFVGGHNNMVDILHQLADGTFVEHCICVISRPKKVAAQSSVPHSDSAKLRGVSRFGSNAAAA